MTSMVAGINQIIKKNGLPKQVLPEIFSRKDIFPDLHLLDGPLKVYRSQSSFDWRKLRLIVEDEESWKLRYKVWNFMENNPLFFRSHETLPLDVQRHQATKRVYTLYNEKFYGLEEYMERPDLSGKYSSAMISYDPNVSVKLSLAFGMFPNTIRTLGSDRTLDIVNENLNAENAGSFALTEIAHGSNARGMRTTATFEKETKTFVLNTPDFEAAKCWVGNLGKTCTHAIVYAQLYTPDGKCHGLNAFVVPIRDKKTLLAFPGVVVGDLGEKIALNGVDNGFVLFNNYKIPKDYMLSKTGDVDDAGNFISQFKDPKKRMGKSLGALSGGRVGICEIASTYGVKAITIATRYAAARQQFGPEDSNVEYPVIEYQAQQYRMLPHLAAVYAVQFFSTFIGKIYGDMTMKLLMGEDMATAGMEIHALSSVGKPICAWTVRDVIQECREACGGHGYLKCARLGDLRNENDANCTYEGENNILIQQGSNFLINTRAKGWSAFGEVSPLGSVDFLKNGEEIKKLKWSWTQTNVAMKPENLLTIFNWICVHLLERTYDKVKQLQASGQSQFDIRNNSQVFYAINLAKAYGHRSLFEVFYQKVQSLTPSPERDVLSKLLSLYGANVIVNNYIGTLYEGSFVEMGLNVCEILQSGILGILPILKLEAVTLVDAIAPPDFIINSPLGMSDGRIYDHLKSVIYQTPGTFERPEWWKDISYRDYIVKSNL
ncbi:CLUMA_CG020967, isoform A [Clunio marinus]|uniref:Acyl-coenzyme A oxidase n=1 Tax=Clunio marinus TaxID=568069 RepID=A0A1J1J6M0_9DIPT|nr:CLUMA_CG020967, isoform A [Clunio marinus]